MSLQSAQWWQAFVDGLASRALSVWSTRLGVPEAELISALIEADPGGPAQGAPWWPEFLRQREHASLRALARRFGSEPRRLRRALARDGLRAGGQELQQGGHPALAAYVSRLGNEPDGSIARAARVSIESVQGERRLRKIAPYRTTAARSLRLTPDEDAWIRGPEPMHRSAPSPSPSPRPRPTVDAFEVVRRARSSVGSARVDTVRIGSSAPPAGSPPKGMLGGAGSHRISRDFFRTKDPSDLDRLLQPAPRQRDGRQRIVRIEEPVVARRPVPQPILFTQPVALSVPLVENVATSASMLVWHVRVPGNETPMVIEAADAWGAARLAAAKLPRQLWGTVGIALAEVDSGQLAW